MLLSSFSFIQSSQTSIVALVQPPSLVMIKINKMTMLMINMREKYNWVMMLLMIKKRRSKQVKR